MPPFSRVLRRLRNAIAPARSAGRRTYVARYQVMVKNTAAKANELAIVAPVPASREGQEMLAPVRFSPAPQRTGADARFGNQFALWTAKLAPGESRLFTGHFTAAVSPIKQKLPKAARRSDYADKPAVFTELTEHLGAGDSQIAALAAETAGTSDDVGELMNRFNELVIGRLEYGNPITGLYSASQALAEAKVDCGGYDSLFVALCIAAGLPARIVSGFWAGYEKNAMHAWAEVQLPGGEWVPADPSTEALRRAGRTNKLGKLGEIGSDRIAFSVGCDIPLDMLKRPRQADILQHPFIEASLGKGSFEVITTVETLKA